MGLHRFRGNMLYSVWKQGNGVGEAHRAGMYGPEADIRERIREGFSVGFRAVCFAGSFDGIHVSGSTGKVHDFTAPGLLQISAGHADIVRRNLVAARTHADRVAG